MIAMEELDERFERGAEIESQTPITVGTWRRELDEPIRPKLIESVDSEEPKGSRPQLPVSQHNGSPPSF